MGLQDVPLFDPVWVECILEAGGGERKAVMLNVLVFTFLRKLY